MVITDTSTRITDVTPIFGNRQQITNQTLQQVAAQSDVTLDTGFQVEPSILPTNFDSAYLVNRDETAGDTETDSFALVKDGDITLVGFNGNTTQVNHLGNGKYSVAGTEQPLRVVDADEASNVTGLQLNNNGSVAPPKDLTTQQTPLTKERNRPTLTALDGGIPKNSTGHTGFSTQASVPASIFEGNANTLAAA